MPDARWRGSHPINAAREVEEIVQRVWHQLLSAFPDLERRDLILVDGEFRDGSYIAAMGHCCGTFRRDWLGIPATGAPVFQRYGEVHRVEGARVAESSCLWDVLDLIRQTGCWPIAPSLGTEGMWPGPITGDGLTLQTGDAEQGAVHLAQTLAMHQALGAYDDLSGQGREGLLTMAQTAFWHPRMMWYGPA